jgi:hypothetical protein
MPALTQAAAAVGRSGNALWSLTRSRRPPPSVHTMPSTPHSRTTISFSIGCTCAGVPSTALYAAISARAPPCLTAISNGFA